MDNSKENSLVGTTTKSVSTCKEPIHDGFPVYVRAATPCGSLFGVCSSPSEGQTIVIQTDQGHPTDPFGGISVWKTCNRLKFSVREMSSRAFLINAFCFRRDKNGVLGTKIGQLGFSERQ